MKSNFLSKVSSFLLLASSILGLGSGTAHAASIISNGGFEAGNFTGWSASGNVSIQKPGPTTALCCETSEGLFYLNFNGGNQVTNGQVFQVLATEIGTSYLLGFDFGKGGGAVGTAALNVAVEGNSSLLSTTVSDSTGGFPGEYSNFQFSFTADSSNTVLTFSDASDGTIDFDALLDNVTVEAEPVSEPFTILVTGLVGFGLMLKKRTI
jgi:hypothetical protein